MFTRHRSEVLVVGAGPVGLFTALRLAQRGVQVQIVDKHWRTGAHGYGLALHPRSLRLLEEAGVAGTLLTQARRVDRVEFYDRARPCGTLSLAEVGGPFPFALVMPQSSLEYELEEQLERLKIKVQWNHRLESQRAEGEELSAEIARLDQVAAGYPIARMEWTVSKTYEFRARYLVGADGYHSTIRNSLEIEYAEVGPLASFSVFEFEAGDDPGNAARVVFDGDLTSVLWPMPGRRCRWSFQIENPAEHESSPERLNALIEARAPWFPRVAGEVHWSSLTQFDRRRVTRMGRDRAWLAGDAAHLTGPFGGQSMNAGLVDGYELAGLLSEMLPDGKTPDRLESYNTQRLRELRALICGDDELIVAEQAGDWVRNHRAAVWSSIPATGGDLEVLAAQVGLRHGT